MNAQQIIKESLRNWIPCSMKREGNSLRCRWIYTKDKAFTEPFFDETIDKCKRFPEYSNTYKSVTTPEAIIEWSAHIDPVYPTAIIFHVSRCGSTLVSQALGMLSNTISLAEVPIFDEVLRLPVQGYAIDDKQVKALLDSTIKFYGARRKGDENRLFVKTDSWHLAFYKELRAMYPDVPFVVMYREPEAVLESNRRKRGIQGVPGLVEPAVYGFDEKQEFFHHPDTYMAAVLEQFYKSILSIAVNDEQATLLNYKEGLSVMMQKIASVTKMILNAEEMAMIAERSLYNAKYPGEKFVEKNTSGISDPALAVLTDLYEQIEAVRMKSFISF